MSASAKTMFGDLPPSSKVTGFKFDFAASTMMACPTDVEPVNAILLSPLWRHIARPGPSFPSCVFSPKPDRMLTVPLGYPASWMSSATRRADRGVCSAVLTTVVHPVARTGASFHASISSGKFHGMIWPTGPMGSILVYELKWSRFV
eukprot:gene18797-biopygen19037